MMNEEKVLNDVLLEVSSLENNEGQIDGVPSNPRQIKKDDYDKLKASIRKENLMYIKPALVYKVGEKYVVIGGNMRTRALKELKVDKCPCKIIPHDTPIEVIRKIAIIDNSNYGEWDHDMLANEWDSKELDDWGVDVWQGEDIPEEESDQEREQGDGQKDYQLVFKLSKEKSKFVEEMIDVAKTRYGILENSEEANGDALYNIIREWSTVKL